jgi:hypothetical protein
LRTINKGKYIIVVPIYKEKLSSNEFLTVRNLLNFYSKESITIVCPESLSLPVQLKGIKTEGFDDKYFENIKGYNKLLLNKEFYKRFENFEFMLIHQLDAYLFRDELDFWCNQDYDYVGAPWLRDERLLVKLFRSKKIKKRDVIFNKVGNGGLSLRKVKTFIDFFKEYENIVEKNIQHELYGIEDVFWSLVAPAHMNFKIPDVKKAAKFSLDRKPNLGFKINSFMLPFGCHGFEKNKTKKFWKKYIKGLA